MNNYFNKPTTILGKLPGLVVNNEESRSEPWSWDVGSIPALSNYYLDGKMDRPLDGRKNNKNNKNSQMGHVTTTTKYF